MPSCTNPKILIPTYLLVLGTRSILSEKKTQLFSCPNFLESWVPYRIEFTHSGWKQKQSSERWTFLPIPKPWWGDATTCSGIGKISRSTSSLIHEYVARCQCWWQFGTLMVELSFSPVFSKGQTKEGRTMPSSTHKVVLLVHHRPGKWSIIAMVQTKAQTFSSRI